MDNLEIQGKHRKLVYIIVGASFTWAVILCIWIFAGNSSSWGVAKALLSYPWAIIALVIGFRVPFWIIFWHKRNDKYMRNTKRTKAFVFLHFFSDALLIASIAGVLWLWPLAVFIPLLIGLALSYAVKFIYATYALATEGGLQGR